MGSPDNARQRRRTKGGGKFIIPTTKQQCRTCLKRMTLQFFNIAFQVADKAMYLLGPLLIALASAIILGLTYVYFRVILPMLAGTNWMCSNSDLDIYWRGRGYEVQGGGVDGSLQISQSMSTLLALSTPAGTLHTLLVSFFLVNILFNYYQCVKTSNSGPSYNLVVRELAEVTGFDYPETEEELVQCKRNFERQIYERMQKMRNEMMAARSANANNAPAAPTGTNANKATNGDEESQSTPLLANGSTNAAPTAKAPATKNAPQKVPKIHNWMLMSPMEWGYCRYSSQPKPPRSHYDHVTRALVLNMDHYCPWMFNCIGYFNYRYFFNFLWFVCTALLYGSAICFPAFMKLGGAEYREQVRASGGFQRPLKDLVVKHIRSSPFVPTPNERTPVALGFMLCACLGLAVMILGGFHLYLVVTAQTTIEFHGNWAKRKRENGWKNPYSAGSWKKNWEMIYGTRYWSYDSADDNISSAEEQYRYRGCWGILMAMMPSRREPEFLPFVYQGRMIRRKRKQKVIISGDGPASEDDMDEEIDLEKAFRRRPAVVDQSNKADERIV